MRGPRIFIFDKENNITSFARCFLALWPTSWAAGEKGVSRTGNSRRVTERHLLRKPDSHDSPSSKKGALSALGWGGGPFSLGELA